MNDTREKLMGARKTYSKCAAPLEAKVRVQRLTAQLSEQVIGIGVAADWIRRAAEMEGITYMGRQLSESRRRQSFVELLRFDLAWFGLNAVFTRPTSLSLVGTPASRSEFSSFHVLSSPTSKGIQVLYYVPNMRRFSQGCVEYCALVSMHNVQATRGGLFNTNAPVPAYVARHGLTCTSLLSMFDNNGFIAVADGKPNWVFSANDLFLALRRFGPIIACGHIKVRGPTYGHAVVVFGVDTTNNFVILKNPRSTLPELGRTDPLSDASVVTLALFNLVLARGSLGDRCLVGKPSGGIQLATVTTPTYVMDAIDPRFGRVFEQGDRSREI